MYKLYVIAKNNIKKQKGDMITFFILTFLASFLIFDAVSALLGMGKVLDDRFSETDGGHLLLVTHDTPEENQSIEKAVWEQECVTDYESTPCLHMTAEHRKAGEKEYNQYMFIATSFEETPRLGHDLEAGKTYDKNDILLPYNLKNTYAIGDTMQIRLGDHEYDLRVADYVPDPYFCSTVNITLYYVFLSDEMIESMKKDEPVLSLASMMHKARIDESYLSRDYTTEDVEKGVTDRYKELLGPYMVQNPERSYMDYMSVNWQAIRGGSQFVPMIIMVIMLLFAVMIIVIAIVIISFSIRNFIHRNMKNTGILEASGYTVSQLRGALSFQIVSVSLLGAIAGTVLGIATFAQFGNIVSLAMGLIWNQSVNPKAAVLTILIPTAVIFLVSRMSSRIYKKISVLDALRGGIHSHNFRRNHFSFEKTPLPISFVVSLKETFGGPGRNLLMVLIMMLITISVLVGFGLYQNFGQDPNSVIRLFGFENATAVVTSTVDIREDLNSLSDVDNVLTLYGLDLSVKKGDTEKMIYTYVMDDIENTGNLTLLDGRIAKHDNEIMITGAAAEDLGVTTGDVVTVDCAGKKADYLISGIYQRMDRMGRTVYMNFDAAEKIMSISPVLQYWVTAKEGVSFDTLNKQIDRIEKDKDTSFDVLDAGRQMDGTMGIVSGAMRILCITIVIITILVVIFVESLIIRARIVKSWRSMGISKALGMTTRQLIAQIQMSNMPAILAGMAAGILLSPSVGSKLCKIVFSLFGLEQVCFAISPVWMLISAIGIVTVALIASGLSGLRVKSLKPVEMIAED